MVRACVISAATFMLVSCGSAVDMNREGAVVAHAACVKAVKAQGPAYQSDMLMIVQIIDSAKRNAMNLKNTKVFTLPATPKANSVKGSKKHAYCMTDMRDRKIIKLHYEKQSIIENVAEELRTF